ncbi:MAG TPA: efflux transporter outer membrane subunit [Verrucomicrobiae bacterium]|nr:efflux transporter outer membrane subunit [Verrucomicrobiae bacterium]
MVFSGCAVGPKYKRPDSQVPPTFRGQPESADSTSSFGELPWWQVFHDDNLQRLVRIALTNNYDLRIATARVEQARAMAAEARSQFFPQINYAALAGRGKNVSGTAPSPTGAGGTVFGSDVNATWEIDLFGRIRRLTEAARAQYFATQEARRDVMISLISQVAQDYFQLLALDRELQIAHDSTNSFGQSLKIFNERLQGGVASKLETSSAEALMDSAAATIPNLERQAAAQEDQLSVLLGLNPTAVSRTNSVFDQQEFPEVPPGLPSQLLERRPDVREAEQELRAANARVGVAVADFFPQLNLTGLFGTVSPELNAFTGGGEAAWSIAANLAGPIFHGGQLRAQYAEARAAREQSALQYQQTILNALQEVSDALIAREKLAEAQMYQGRAVDAYQEAVKIAMERYKLGHADYYEVLQEQQLLFPAENTLVQTQLDQFLSVVELYRALGGGWEVSAKN